MNKHHIIGSIAALVCVGLIAGVAVGQIPDPNFLVYMPAVGQAPTETPTQIPTQTATPTATATDTPVPTAAPTITATPRPQVVSISNLFFGRYVNSDVVVVLGILTNETDQSISMPSVNIVLRAANGTILNGGNSNLLYSFDKLPPNGKTPFFISLPNSPSIWASYEMVPRWQNEGRTVAALEIVQSETYYDGNRQFHARGYVRNSSVSTVTFPEAFLVLYNSKQQVIGMAYVSLGSTFQMPETSQIFFDSATTWAGYPDTFQVVRHDIWAYGYGSNTVTLTATSPGIPAATATTDSNVPPNATSTALPDNPPPSAATPTLVP